MKNKLVEQITKIIEKIGKQNAILIAFILFILGITGLYQTFSLYTASDGVSIIDGIKTYKFILDSENTTNTVVVGAGNTKHFDITIENKETLDLQYGLYYSYTGDVSNINIAYSSENENLAKGIAKSNDKFIIKIVITNISDTDITFQFGIKYGFENGGSLVLDENEYWFEEQIIANAPNLDNDNLIPVYYDDTVTASDGSLGVWKKADSNNSNNSWYDYDNKKWANAIMISDNNKRVTYQSAEEGTIITDSDISAFLVWIPRFKYRVWNITRQGGGENTYAYSAYTNGIDIVWENGTASTGNVSCIYNIANTTPATTLSDVCTVNGTTITPESGNANFTNAWYTHPAFTFDNEKTGFWIGKFETTGTAESPTVLPDTISLRGQNVSSQFTTSKVFQNYLSNNMDAHMLTNLEWGAVAYLSHSIYGLCDGVFCRDVYINNSSNFLTGRSAGVLSPNTSYNAYGTYNYKGYLVGDTTKDISKIGSTTGNVTGVYDMSGGGYEYVIGNMVDENNLFYPYKAGSSWNGSSTLDSKYYNSYSYGLQTTQNSTYNRARLGDATAEVVGSNLKTNDVVWQPGSGITGARSSFVSSLDSPWFLRGGGSDNTDAGSFDFSSISGDASGYYSFRLSIS